MNRLIIVGNGFDLAHGMKTSYYDFILNYISSSFRKVQNGGTYDDVLMAVTKNSSYSDSSSEPSTLVEFKRYMNEANGGAMYFLSDLDERNYDIPKRYSWKIKNIFFKKLILHCCDFKWVDIENEYYVELLKILNKEKSSPQIKTNEIKELNDVFKYMIEQFERYFSGVEIPTLNKKMKAVFQQPLHKNEFPSNSFDLDQKLESVMILNFNFTSTHKLYLPTIRNSYNGKIDSNYIHGSLKDSSNSLVFGFGDEIDEQYKKIENDKTEGFLDYVKTFAYLKTSNYRRLLEFIDLAPYQIHILGHSCGLSDRTLLKLVFEHKNCLSIKIFYHQKEHYNNYTNLTQAISRNFTDNGLMRKKVVDFTLSCCLPQSGVC